MSVPSDSRRTIPATCTTHGGTPGFVSLVARKINGGIGMLRDALTEWLG